MMEKDEMRREECESFLTSLSAYLDGELSEADAEKIKYHIDNCAECRAVYEKFAAVSADIKSIEPEIPEDLHDRIMGAVRSAGAEKKKSTVQSRMRRYGLWIGAAAAAMICLAVIGSPIFKGGIGMDLAKNMSDAAYVVEEDNGLGANKAQECAAEADVYYSDMIEEAPEDAQMDGIEINIPEACADDYYSTTGNGVNTATDNEGDGTAKTKDTIGVKQQSDETKLEVSEWYSDDILDRLCYVCKSEEFMEESAEVISFPNFFPERGRLTP